MSVTTIYEERETSKPKLCCICLKVYKNEQSFNNHKTTCKSTSNISALLTIQFFSNASESTEHYGNLPETKNQLCGETLELAKKNKYEAGKPSYLRSCNVGLKTYKLKQSFHYHEKTCNKNSDTTALNNSYMSPLSKNNTYKTCRSVYPKKCQICLKTYKSKQSFSNHNKTCKKTSNIPSFLNIISDSNMSESNNNPYSKMSESSSKYCTNISESNNESYSNMSESDNKPCNDILESNNASCNRLESNLSCNMPESNNKPYNNIFESNNKTYDRTSELLKKSSNGSALLSIKSYSTLAESNKIFNVSILSKKSCSNMSESNNEPHSNIPNSNNEPCSDTKFNNKPFRDILESNNKFYDKPSDFVNNNNETCNFMYPRMCDVCLKTYNSKQSFSNHKKICKQYGNIIALSDNVLSSNKFYDKPSDFVNNNNETCNFMYPRTCDVCLKTYNSRQSFSYHKKKCKQYENIVALSDNVLSSNISESNNKFYDKPSEFVNNNNETCNFIYPRKCDVCLKTFNSRQSFSYHKKVCSTSKLVINKNNYETCNSTYSRKCNVCLKTYNSRQSFSYHKKKCKQNDNIVTLSDDVLSSNISESSENIFLQ